MKRHFKAFAFVCMVAGFSSSNAFAHSVRQVVIAADVVIDFYEDFFATHSKSIDMEVKDGIKAITDMINKSHLTPENRRAARELAYLTRATFGNVTYETLTTTQSILDALRTYHVTPQNANKAVIEQIADIANIHDFADKRMQRATREILLLSTKRRI